MSPIASRIDEFDVIPLAFSDPPLLNAAGVHEPLALRTLVRLRVGRVVAWGEGRGDALPPEVVGAVREVVLGEDVFATNRQPIVAPSPTCAAASAQPGMRKSAMPVAWTIADTGTVIQYPQCNRVSADACYRAPA